MCEWCGGQGLLCCQHHHHHHHGEVSYCTCRRFCAQHGRVYRYIQSGRLIVRAPCQVLAGLLNSSVCVCVCSRRIVDICAVPKIIACKLD